MTFVKVWLLNEAEKNEHESVKKTKGKSNLQYEQFISEFRHDKRN